VRAPYGDSSLREEEQKKQTRKSSNEVNHRLGLYGDDVIRREILDPRGIRPWEGLI
jgi:hypothetical protein